jgi:tetratricopeptide (TPR) repeat protein
MGFLLTHVFFASAVSAQGWVIIGWSCALVAGVLKCIRIARRPTTSALCCTGLALALLSWLSFMILGSLDLDQPVALLLKVLLGFSGVTLAIGSVCVSIVGLAMYGRNSDFVQGRKQAVWGLVISVFLFGCVIAGVASRLVSERGLPIVGAAQVKNEPVEFDSLNLRYCMPPGYSTWNARTINPNVTLGAMRVRPTVCFMMIAERGGADLAIDTAGLAEISRAFLRSAATECTMTDPEPHTVNGLEGLRFRSDATAKGKLFTYCHWVVARNGYFYQLIVFGARKDKARIFEEAERLFAGFEQIDRERQDRSDDSRPFEDFRSSRYPLTVRLGGTDWVQWPEACDENPESEVGGLYGADGGFLIAPLLYPEGVPRPNLDAAVRGLLKPWGMSYPDDLVGQPEVVSGDGVDTLTAVMTQTVGEITYQYRIRVMSSSRAAFLITVWSQRGGSDIDMLAGQVFAGSSVGWSGEFPVVSSLRAGQIEGHAEAYNAIGLFYHGARNMVLSQGYFRAAAALCPDKMVYLTNTLQAYNELGQAVEALDYLDTRTPAMQENDVVRAWRAWFLKLASRTDESLGVYESLFSGGYREDEDLESYVTLLADAGESEKAQAVCERYCAASESVDTRIVQARLLRGQGDAGAALDLLKAVRGRVPYTPDLEYALVDCHNALEQYREALTVCDGLLAQGYGSADSYYSKGEAEYNLKWYRRAKSSLEEALRRSPEDAEVKDFLRHVSGLLGEGNNSNVKGDIDPVALPSAVSSRLPDLTAQPTDADYSAYYIHYVTGIRYEPGKEYKQTLYQRIRVLDTNGVSRFSTMQVDFDPLSEQACVNELTVRDASGAVVARGQPSDWYVIDRQHGELETHEQTLHIPVPGLQPGATVDLVTTVKHLGAPECFQYLSRCMASVRPVIFGAVYLEGSPEVVRFETANGVRSDRLPHGMVWTVANPPVYRWEPLQVNVEKVLPWLWIADAGLDWKSEVDEYFEDIRPKLEEEEAVIALARKVVADSPRESAVEALTAYVRDSITYKPLEFGRRAWVPNSAGRILANRYGDCKDHSVLLHRLLSAVGVPSWLALVNTSGDSHPKLPTMDQFDHMILFTGLDGPRRFIDCTDKTTGGDTPAPIGLGDRQALILDCENVRFETIAPYGRNTSVFKLSRDMRIDDEDRLQVQDNLRLTGYTAAFLRSHFQSIEAAKRVAWAQAFVADYEKSATVEDIVVKNLRDNEEALEVQMKYTVADSCRTVSGDRVFRVPAVWEADYLQVQPQAQRRTPFRIEYPFRMDVDVAVHVPRRYTLVSTGVSSADGSHACAEWNARREDSAERHAVACTCRLHPGTFEPDQYASYSEAMRKAVTAATGEVRCRAAKPVQPTMPK